MIPTRLPANEIHVWIADWPARPSGDMRSAAESAWTRGVLAGYLGVAPDTLAFARGAFGKPRLAGAGVDGPLEFNLSHSGGIIALAVARDGVGVDIEAVRPLPELDAMAARSLAATEHREWTAAPPERRLDVFHRLWTRKEACLKAAGTGLVANLADVCATPLAGLPGVRHVLDWRLGGHHAAVASTCALARVDVRVFDHRVAASAAVAPAA